METFSALLALCAGNSPVAGEFPAQMPVFSVIFAWIKDWVNNREAGDLRRHRAHNDVIVMVIGKHSVREVWLLVDMHAGGCSAHQILNAHKIPISPVCCQQQLVHSSTVGFRSRTLGAVAQAHIRCSAFSCRPGCHSCRWSSHSLLSWRTLWYRFYYVFGLIYLIVFITDCFIRTWHIKRILIPGAFVALFCMSNWFLYLLDGLLIGWLVVWLFSYCFLLWLVDSFWFVLVHSGAGWLLAWPHHDHYFTHWFHRTHVQY